MTSNDPVADCLLVHASFVQRLARSLAGQDADDLAQETFAAALAAPSADVRNARGWLATIASNLWRNRRRGELRRALREAQRAASADAPSVDAILQREEVRRRVVAAVVALPEALRTVVLLRFFEGLDSSVIGRKLSLPPSTVRARLQQALEKLRARLDEMHGDRRAAWAGPVAALAAGGSVLRASWPLRSALGAIAAMLLAWLAWPLFAGSAAPPPVSAGGPVEVAMVPHADTPAAEPTTARDPLRADPVAASEHGPEDFWGRVVAAADERPVAGAEVVLEHRDADEMICLDLDYARQAVAIGSARTDAQGRFHFRVQRALQHRLVVSAAGFAERRDDRCTGGSEVVVRLEPAAFVEGVVRKLDGTPLADALVAARVRGSDGAAASTRTTSDGAFLLGGLDDKPTFICAEPEGMLDPDWQLVELEAGKGARVEIAVAAGRTLRGVVRDAETGQPIGGAAIAAGWTMEHAVLSAADGSYEFKGFGTAGDLYVRADDYADLVRNVAEAGYVARCDLALARGDTVTGRIVDAANAPVSGAYVAAVADAWGRGGVNTFWRTGKVAADGRFVVTGLPATAPFRGETERALQWHLLVRAAGFGARVLALAQRPQRAAAFDAGPIELAAQGIIEGRVVDRDAHPVASVQVELRGQADRMGQLLPPKATTPAPGYHLSTRETTTGSDGTYRFAGVGAGEYYGVHVTPEGKDWSVGSGQLAIVAGAVVTVPDIVLDPGLMIAGHVRGNGIALPAGARLSIYAIPEQKAEGERRRVDLGRDGSFRIERLAKGTYLVCGFDVPKGLAIVPQHGVAAGREGLELALVPAATIEGRVVGVDGKPVAGMHASFLPEGEMFLRQVTTDVDGRFRIEAAPGVTGRLTAQDPGNMFRSVTQENVTAGTRDLVLQLPR